MNLIKLIISGLLVLTLIGSGQSQKSCQCRTATPDDKTIWGHIATELEEVRIKRVYGVVRNPLEQPLENALVEIFVDDGTNITPTSISKKRLAGCVTGEKGKFCFDRIKDGKYILAIGCEGFNITFIRLTVNKDGRGGSAKPLNVSLNLGT